MPDDLSRVLREAQEAARGRGEDVVHRLAEKLGVHASAGAVFGQPVERDGITVIPVAKVRCPGVASKKAVTQAKLARDQAVVAA
jgi:hypothetical protein